MLRLVLGFLTVMMFIGPARGLAAAAEADVGAVYRDMVIAEAVQASCADAAPLGANQRERYRRNLAVVADLLLAGLEAGTLPTEDGRLTFPALSLEAAAAELERLREHLMATGRQLALRHGCSSPEVAELAALHAAHASWPLGTAATPEPKPATDASAPAV